MNVYLAGKVSRRCWRHDYVKEMPSIAANKQWPILKNAIAETLNYCGPFFYEAGHGLSHGESTHGNSVMNCEPLDSIGMGHVFDNCLCAIHRTDAMIAHVTPNSYGTLVEIGYFKALFRTRFGNDKFLFVFCSDDCHVWQESYGSHSQSDMEHCRNDLWFAEKCVSHGMSSEPKNIQEAIQYLCAVENEKRLIEKCESPSERQFFEAFKIAAARQGMRSSLVPQVQVGKYRLDFGNAELQVGFEIDGHNFHSTKDQIRNDMQRQRHLAELGWVIHRFTGSEVYHSASSCAEQAIRLLKSKAMR